jgi:DNA invertase Pin-like site-specific DNA recombinase
LAEQEASVRAWARARRHRIVEVLHDVTSDLEGRAGFAEALALLGDGRATGLVVSRLDVLADHVVAQEQLVAEVRRVGGRVHIAHEVPGDAAGADGTSRHLVREVLRHVAHNERSIRALRSRAQGRSNGVVGAPAYGFEVQDGELRPTSAEQAAIARIAELQAQGATLRQMVRALEAEGHRPKRGKRWHPETIRRILNRLDA